MALTTAAPIPIPEKPRPVPRTRGPVLRSRLEGDDSDAVRPVDRLLSGYNLLVAAAWIAVAAGGSVLPSTALAAGVAGSAHLAAATLPSLIHRLPESPHTATLLLRETYPLLWLGAFWAELDILIGSLHTGSHDATIRALDLALFGTHPHRAWSAAMPWAWLGETMNLIYLAYYGLIFLPPLAVLVAGRRDALRDMMLRLMVTYIGCYLIYLLHPVVGPRLTDPVVAESADGFFRQVVAILHTLGDSRGTAFPSSHVAGAVTIAILGRRWFSRPVAILLTVQAAGVILATVYTGNHYAADALAGVGLTLGLQAGAVPFVERHLARRSSLPEAPVLPIHDLPGHSV